MADESVGRMWEVFADVRCSETGERMKEVLLDGREEGGYRGREKGEVEMMEKSWEGVWWMDRRKGRSNNGDPCNGGINIVSRGRGNGFGRGTGARARAWW